jgi:hypothetical protein
MTAENGFGNTVMHIRDTMFGFEDSITSLTNGQKYKMKARVYVPNSSSIGDIVLLPMSMSGMQSGL